MKLPFTEEFLWDLYNLIEKVDDFLSKGRTFKEAFFPDLYELRRKYQKKKNREEFSKLVSYLKKKGWIEIKDLKEKKAVILTPSGIERVLKIKDKFSSLPRRKDEKLIMAAFDIPEKEKTIRDYFREKLIELGFKKYQKSIWISPYDVLDRLKEIVQNLGIEKYVKIFLIEEAEF